MCYKHFSLSLSLSLSLSVIFLHLPEAFEIKTTPKVLCQVRIFADMTFDCFVNDCRISSSLFSHLVKLDGVISSESEITNLLAAVKALTTKDSDCDNNKLINMAIDCLQQCLNNIEDENTCGLMSFFIEQLLLCQKSVHARRYSANLILVSFLWHMASSSLYKRLRELFCLPTKRWLQKLSSGTTVSPFLFDQKHIYATQKCNILCCRLYR